MLLCLRAFGCVCVCVFVVLVWIIPCTALQIGDLGSAMLLPGTGQKPHANLYVFIGMLLFVSFILVSFMLF